MKSLDYNIFNELKEYINSKNIGEVIYRKDLFNYIGNYISIDQYRRRLTILGYLCSLKNGQYKINKHIPENFNTVDSYAAYGNKRINLKNKKLY